jgi:hypothetical protein
MTTGVESAGEIESKCGNRCGAKTALVGTTYNQ